ncbi:hypothetical protein LTR65_003775 [Meristemomyces frigidus]
MQIRPAQRADLVAASKVCAAAFFDETLFGDIIHPFRHEYPEDTYLYWLKYFRVAVGQADNHFFVATAPEANGSSETVVALAHWVRKRAKHSGDAAAPPEEPKEQEADKLPPNRAADPKNVDILERSDAFASHHWSDKADHPQCHGQGIGRQLVAWGFEQSDRDGACVSVIAADGKDTFYQRCGFTTITGRAGDGEGNPLIDVPGGLILFRDV